MSRIFLIPGMGADARIYKNIDLNGHEVIPVNWLIPQKTDTLTTYAQKLVQQYHISSGSILMGNSLGGMLAMEIAKMVQLKQVILISSIKTKGEAPDYFKFFKKVPVYKIIPNSFLTAAAPLLRLRFGNMGHDDLQLFKDMLKNSSPVLLKWAMGAALQFNNETLPKNVHHINGDDDRVFDHDRITGATIIKGGTHIMLFDRAHEINAILKTILAN